MRQLLKQLVTGKQKFAVFRCVVCNHEFQVLFTKIIAPKSKEEIYLIPKITKARTRKDYFR